MLADAQVWCMSHEVSSRCVQSPFRWHVLKYFRAHDANLREERTADQAAYCRLPRLPALSHWEWVGSLVPVRLRGVGPTGRRLEDLGLGWVRSFTLARTQAARVCAHRSCESCAPQVTYERRRRAPLRRCEVPRLPRCSDHALSQLARLHTSPRTRVAAMHRYGHAV